MHRDRQSETVCACVCMCMYGVFIFIFFHFTQGRSQPAIDSGDDIGRQAQNEGTRIKLMRREGSDAALRGGCMINRGGMIYEAKRSWSKDTHLMVDNHKGPINGQ